MSGTFRDLKCWQKAFDLSLAIYSVTRSFPKEEIFGLTSQLRRASVSVVSNIAEGKGRSSEKDLLRFLANSRGSLFEQAREWIDSGFRFRTPSIGGMIANDPLL